MSSILGCVDEGNHQRRSYSLPTNGWRPGMPSTLALRAGPFHALLTPTGVTAWVGAERCPMTWPDGFSVRLEDSIELLGPDGQVLAREGDVLYATGGMGSDGTFAIGPLERQEDWDRRQVELRRAPRDLRDRLPNQ